MVTVDTKLCCNATRFKTYFRILICCVSVWYLYGKNSVLASYRRVVTILKMFILEIVPTSRSFVRKYVWWKTEIGKFLNKLAEDFKICWIWATVSWILAVIFKLNIIMSNVTLARNPHSDLALSDDLFFCGRTGDKLLLIFQPSNNVKYSVCNGKMSISFGTCRLFQTSKAVKNLPDENICLTFILVTAEKSTISAVHEIHDNLY